MSRIGYEILIIETDGSKNLFPTLNLHPYIHRYMNKHSCMHRYTVVMTFIDQAALFSNIHCFCSSSLLTCSPLHLHTPVPQEPLLYCDTFMSHFRPVKLT